MDLAVPVGGYRSPKEPEWLRWVLRTWAHHYPPDRVFIVGQWPHYLDPAQVTYIPTIQNEGKWANTETNLRAVMESDISEDFIWTNDDIFLLRDLDSLPLYASGTIADRISPMADKSGSVPKPTQEFYNGMFRQAHAASIWGYDPTTALCCDLHVPIPVTKSRLKETLDRRDDLGSNIALEPVVPRGHWRMLYGLGLEAEVIEDRKFYGSELPEVSDTFASIAPSAWRRNFGHYIRNRYWRASPWEAQ